MMYGSYLRSKCPITLSFLSLSPLSEAARPDSLSVTCPMRQAEHPILYYLKWFVRHASQSKWTWTKSVSCPWSHQGWTNKKYKLFLVKKTRFCGLRITWHCCAQFFLLKCQCHSECAQNHFICIFFIAEELFSLISSNFTA